MRVPLHMLNLPIRVRFIASQTLAHLSVFFFFQTYPIGIGFHSCGTQTMVDILLK